MDREYFQHAVDSTFTLRNSVKTGVLFLFATSGMIALCACSGGLFFLPSPVYGDSLEIENSAVIDNGML